MNEKHEDTFTLEPEHNSLVKLVFLGVIALALSASGPLSLFAAVPLCLVFLLFGRAKGVILVFTGLLATIGLAQLSMSLSHVWGIYLFAALNCLVITEHLFRKTTPTKGVVNSGFIMLGVLGAFFVIFTTSLNTSLEGEVEKTVMQTIEAIKSNKENQAFLKGNDEKAIALREFVENPKEVVTQIMNWLPALIFVSVFFTIWVSYFILLRNGLFWRHKIKYPYSLKDLTGFRLPDYFVWPLIVGLALYAGGEYVFGPSSEVIGGNILFALGVFYFFQGFGIYLDTLTHFKIFGLFRTILIMMTLFMAWQIVVLLGVFDTWVDFRKFLKKKEKNDEGDTL